MDICEKNKNGYIVRISENALISLILSGLEAYVVENRCETYGSLYGYSLPLANDRTLYNVELITVDTSAERKKDAVIYNETAIQLKRDTIRAFWPHLDYLGDFHLHSYKHYKEVKVKKGFCLSDGDKKDLKENSDFWQKIGYRVCLLLTVATLKKKGFKEPNWIAYNCIEFTLKTVRVWLSAYIVYFDSEKGHLVYSEHNDPSIILECPSITGLIGEYMNYGKILLKPRKIIYESVEE